MKTIYIRGIDPKSKSSRMVGEHLKELGHTVVRNRTEPHDAILCWGCSTRDLEPSRIPALNSQVNLFNKYDSLLRFRRAGVTIPLVFSIMDGEDKLEEYNLPWFARQIHHERGKDIICCEKQNDVRSVIKNRTADFFSVYIPHDEEIRVWVFDGKAFAIYHKQYAHHGLHNYKTLESRTELRDDLLGDRKLCNSAILSVKAMKMDFGAVDILRGKDGKDYVLEVNSTPDISSMIRVSGIRLAKLISNWSEAQ